MPHLPVRSFVVLGQYDICHSYPSLTWYFCVKTQKSPPHLRMPQLILPNLPIPFMILTVSHYEPVPFHQLIGRSFILSIYSPGEAESSSRVLTHCVKFVVRARLHLAPIAPCITQPLSVRRQAGHSGRYRNLCSLW